MHLELMPHKRAEPVCHMVSFSLTLHKVDKPFYAMAKVHLASLDVAFLQIHIFWQDDLP